MLGRLGQPVDRVVGLLSRVLYGFRGAGENTVGDLGPYFDAPVEELFPAPVVPRGVRRTRPKITLGPRVVETLRWHSQHVVLCPHYRARHADEYLLNQRVVARGIHPRTGTRATPCGKSSNTGCSCSACIPAARNSTPTAAPPSTAPSPCTG